MSFDLEFESLKEIIYSDELKQSQDNQLNSVADVFESAEENKLEQTRVHNEYKAKFEIQIVDQVKSKSPSFDEASFVQELGKRMKDSSITDRTVFDTLSSFEDFTLFKELVLEQKKGSLNPHNQSITLTDWNEANVVKILAEPHWVVNQQADNRTSWQHDTRSGYYKMHALVTDIPWENALHYQTDVKWRMHVLKNNPERSFKTLDIWDVTDTSYKGRQTMALPMMSDRENLFEVQTKVNEDKTRILLVSQNIEHSKQPKDPNIVRMEQQRFIIVQKTDAGQTQEVLVSNDMGLWIPRFALNWMIGKGFNKYFVEGLEDCRNSPKQWTKWDK